MPPSLVSRSRSPLASLLDQGLVSVSGFVGILLAARLLEPLVFGTVVLVVGTLYVLGGLQTALAGHVHNVLGAGREGSAYRNLTGLLLSVQGAFVLLVCAVTLVGALVGDWLAPDSDTVTVLWGMALLGAPQLLRDGLRRMLYTQRRFGILLPMSALSFLTLAAGWGLVWTGSLPATADSAFLVFGASSGVGAALGLAGMVRDGVAWDRAVWLADFREGWRLSRVLVAGEVVRMVNSNLASWLLALSAGLPALGAYRAAVHVTNALNPIQQAVGYYLPAAASREWDRRDERVYAVRMQRTLLLLMLPMAGAAFLMAVGIDPILGLLYGTGYAVYPMALVFTLTVMARVLDFGRTSVQTVMVAARRPGIVLGLAVVQAVLLVTVGQYLIREYSILGSAAWELTIRVVQAIIAFAVFRRLFGRTDEAPVPQTGDLLGAGSEAEVRVGDDPGHAVKRYHPDRRHLPRVREEAEVLERLARNRPARPGGFRFPKLIRYEPAAGAIHMERARGVPLLETGPREAASAGIAVADGLLHYIETVGEPFHDLTPVNVLWDPEAREAWFVDVASRDLVPGREALGPEGLSLGYYLGAVAYEAARPESRRRTAFALGQTRLLRAALKRLRERGRPANRADLLATAWAHFEKAAFRRGTLRRLWYGSIGLTAWGVLALAVLTPSWRRGGV